MHALYSQLMLFDPCQASEQGPWFPIFGSSNFRYMLITVVSTLYAATFSIFPGSIGLDKILNNFAIGISFLGFSARTQLKNLKQKSGTYTYNLDVPAYGNCGKLCLPIIQAHAMFNIQHTKSVIAFFRQLQHKIITIFLLLLCALLLNDLYFSILLCINTK